MTSVNTATTLHYVRTLVVVLLSILGGGGKDTNKGMLLSCTKIFDVLSSFYVYVMQHSYCFLDRCGH